MGASQQFVQNLRSQLVRSGWSHEIIKQYLEKNKLSTPSPFAIRLKNISKRFGKHKILEQVSIDIAPGEIFGIIGLSGTGKTTLLNIIVGFVHPDSGDVLVNYKNKQYSMFRHQRLLRPLFGFSTQDASFYRDLTVQENLEHFASLYDLDDKTRKTRAKQVLQLVGLAETSNSLAKNLSGGMQKRLDIGCAIMHNPRILILDEPTADLDPLMRQQIWRLIRDVNAAGTTVLIASHFLDEIENVSTRIGILRNKRVLEVGTPDELRVIYSKNYQLKLKSTSGDYRQLLATLRQNPNLGIKKVERKDDFLVMHTSNPGYLLDFVVHTLAGLQDSIESVIVSKPSVKELFESLVT